MCCVVVEKMCDRGVTAATDDARVSLGSGTLLAFEVLFVHVQTLRRSLVQFGCRFLCSDGQFRSRDITIIEYSGPVLSQANNLLTDSTNERRLSLVTFVPLVAMALGLLWQPSTAYAEPAPVLSPAQQLALARIYAPTLVFHPQEQYFPTNPRPSSVDEVVAAWSSRVDQYRALTPGDKLGRAALAYRVFTRVDGDHVEVVVEYWCYYVYNAYTVRGGWFPYRVHDDHPHDLERLYLVLTPVGAWSDGADEQWARDAFRVSRIVANAHDGSIAPNQYRAKTDAAVPVPVQVMVEHGSHAMAPDIDRDGRFTPGVDSDNVLKAQWGIRDKGSTWRWYLHSFMQPREASAIRLCGPESDLAVDVCPRYSLYPAEGLQHWFQELRLSSEDREEILGRTSWLMKAFGDVRVEELMVPADPANGHALDRMLNRRSSSETGFVVGFTTVDHSPTLVLGRRRHWELPIGAGYAPDILAEGVALLSNGRTLFEGTVWGSYRVDAITNVMIGYGWFTESGSASLAAGTEIRAGRFRVRPSWRLNDGGFDARFTTTF